MVDVTDVGADTVGVTVLVAVIDVDGADTFVSVTGTATGTTAGTDTTAALMTDPALVVAQTALLDAELFTGLTYAVMVKQYLVLGWRPVT